MTLDQFPSLDGAAGGGLVLDTQAHRYWYNGQRVAGVTEILTGVGIIDSRWFDEAGRERGTAVHRAMELLVQGRLDWASLDARIVGYVRAGERFCRENGVVIGDPRTRAEHLVYSRAYRYAGKLDALLYLMARDPAAIDWKTGDVGRADLQTAAYADPIKEETGLRRLARLAVKLNEDGTYKVTEFTASRDHELFCAAALIYNTYHLPNRKDDDEQGS